MTDLEYRPVAHDHNAFVARALRRKGFEEVYGQLAVTYALVRELLNARLGANLTQGEVARRMGTTKSAVSRLESGGPHSPSLATLRRYAKAVGCEVEVRLVPARVESSAAGHVQVRGVDALRDEVALLGDVSTAVEQVASGRGSAHEEARPRVEKRLRRR